MVVDRLTVIKSGKDDGPEPPDTTTCATTPWAVPAKKGKRRRARSAHLPEIFGIGSGRTRALEYDDRTIELSIPFVPIVPPAAGLYGAD
jgi:hypothetical protein